MPLRGNSFFIVLLTKQTISYCSKRAGQRDLSNEHRRPGSFLMIFKEKTVVILKESATFFQVMSRTHIVITLCSMEIIIGWVKIHVIFPWEIIKILQVGDLYGGRCLYWREWGKWTKQQEEGDYKLMDCREGNLCIKLVVNVGFVSIDQPFWHLWGGAGAFTALEPVLTVLEKCNNGPWPSVPLETQLIQ